jgi:hypothetical protein
MINMSNLDSPSHSSELNIFDNQQFSREEMVILKLLLAKKIKSSLFYRMRYIATQISYTLQDKSDIDVDILNIASGFAEVTHAEYEEFKEIATCLGINKKRFQELNDYVYEMETGKYKF